MKEYDSRAIAVVGPTASGKTRQAVRIARVFNGEIVSGDSRQVYVGMDIGTGKDLADYDEIPYHLIDIAPAGSKYNLHRYLMDFRHACDDIEGRGKRVVICGGTGMYVEKALAGLRLPEVPENPELRVELSEKGLEELAEILKGYKTLHNVTDIDTKARAIRAIEIEKYYIEHPEASREADETKATPMDCLIIGLDIDRELRRERITRRLDQRLEEGMVDEIRRLLDSGIKTEDLIYYGLEYKFVTKHVIGELSYKEMRDGLETAIHQFAKRQMTWYRGMERRGFKIHWLPYDIAEEDLIAEVRRLL